MTTKNEIYQDQRTERFFEKKENEIYHQLLPAIEELYALKIDNLTFLGARCQMDKFRLDTARDTFLLNIHNARLPERMWNRLAAIESQLVWQEALAQDTNLTTQTPVLNQQGDRVTLLPYANANAETVKCALLNWIFGEPQPETPKTAQIVTTPAPKGAGFSGNA